MDCPSLVSLPEWIGDLTSPQELGVVNCLNLKSLPEGVRRLTSLRRLTTAECPHSEERCEQRMGEDWPKIAHVPNFRNDGDGNRIEWNASQTCQIYQEEVKVLRVDASSNLANNQICISILWLENQTWKLQCSWNSIFRIGLVVINQIVPSSSSCFFHLGFHASTSTCLGIVLFSLNSLLTQKVSFHN
ncbi:uncharacterized protein LOC132181626 [Corylus avellana]|uniref:uncharacterized protein LOC132181626 n=1 Tax=Corylus avellana TaxID=13451 RepID=UPI00286D43CD|nr:uncharacterized protein LOC132181626 [Corylus avellana]